MPAPMARGAGAMAPETSSPPASAMPPERIETGAAAATSRSTVVGVVAATMSAQVASIMASAIFPVIAVKLAAELEVPAAMIGYQVSIVYGTAFLTAALMSTLIARHGACRRMTNQM